MKKRIIEKILYVLSMAGMNKKVRYTYHKSLLAGVFAFAFLVSANAASAALSAAGPISSSNGFPVYFQDQNGIAVELCLGANPGGGGLPDPNCVLPGVEQFGTPAVTTFDPALPVSFPSNFPSESFYYLADAVGSDGSPVRIGAAGTKASFRMVLESAFASASGEPEAGQQIVFMRINLRIPTPANLTPNSVYTATYPFGTFTFSTDDTGNVIKSLGNQAFRTEDGTFTPPLTSTTVASFLGAPNTKFGPFLKAVNPAPPAGYVGNPLVSQTIEPGPNGAFFRIDGPDIGGAGINTIETSFWNVAGKIAVIDTAPPTVVSVTPAEVVVDSTGTATNTVVTAHLTDDLGVRSAKIDLGAFGNNFTATLNGAQVVPSAISGATGAGTFTIDTIANKLSFDISYSGLIGGAETSAQIHGPAILGANALSVFDLPLGASKVGVWNYPESLEADILAGRMYVDVRSLLFPNGEIRGQISPTSNVQNMILTSGTMTDGNWGVVIPSITRTGIFNLPITVSDGSNTTVASHALSVVTAPAPVPVPDPAPASPAPATDPTPAPAQTPVPSPVLTSISVTPATASVVVAGTSQFTASALDQNSAALTVQPIMTWTSSDTAVATVDTNGLVTAVSAGSANITATIGAIVSNAAVVTVTAPAPAPAAPTSPAASNPTPAVSAASGGGGGGGGGGSPAPSSGGGGGGGGGGAPFIAQVSNNPVQNLKPGKKFEGCEGRQSGFSVTTGRSCVGNSSVAENSSSAGQVLGAQSFHFSRSLRKGSKGNEVIELQKFLNSKGYNLGTPDGKFGSKTRDAVIKFQIVNKLKGNGIVGPKVIALLNKSS